MESRKTKTKLTTKANQRDGKYQKRAKKNSKAKHANHLKGGKT